MKANKQSGPKSHPILRQLPIILLSMVFGVVGQLLLKTGADSMGPFDPAANGLLASLAQMFGEPAVVLGYPFFIMGTLFWLVVLSRLDLSYAYPFLGLNYLLIALTSWLILGEDVHAGRWLAISLIVVGILIVGRGGHTPAHQAVKDE